MNFLVWNNNLTKYRCHSGSLDELATIQVVSKRNEERGRVLRDELIEISTGIGICPGDILDASNMELRVRIMQHTRRKLDRAALERLGVSPMVLDEATLRNQGNPHVRLERLDSGGGLSLSYSYYGLALTDCCGGKVCYLPKLVLNCP